MKNRNLMTWLSCLIMAAIVTLSCNSGEKTAPEKVTQTTAPEPIQTLPAELQNMYTEFKLTTDLSVLSENEKKMIPILIEVADIMDGLFWIQAYGPKEPFLASIQDPATRKFAEINYGPWNRLEGNKPFLPGVDPKPAGARFYPADVTKEEVDAAGDPNLKSLYTMVTRDEQGKLKAIPYSQFFAEPLAKASEKLKQAAELAEDAGLKKYLQLRAEALLSDTYYESDLAWMDMKTNGIDFVVGPIEVYEDKLFNAKAAFEAYVLIKDKAWSERLARYAALLPELQRGLPVEETYKTEKPGTDSDLNAYDVVYYAGDCNAGSKTIAINLPNDEKVQLQKGTRRLQLKNAMRAKFDKILVPIADVLIAEDQRKHITFDAFFANTMFHEVAHGLGIKNTINGKGTVREALKEQGSALEEGKADILGLYMIAELMDKGEVQGDIRDYYVTFIAGIFRSVRFGAASAHGRANMLRFNFFQEQGAFSRDENGIYRVNFDKVEAAVAALTQKILKLQGDGDYEGVVALMKEQGIIRDQLQSDLDRLTEASIPTDIVFDQGLKALGL